MYQYELETSGEFMFSEAGVGGGRANRIVDRDLHFCGKLDPDPDIRLQ
jgi:hypothetical protein